MTIAVPVSWQPGSTIPAATLAFFNNSSATNLRSTTESHVSFNNTRMLIDETSSNHTSGQASNMTETERVLVIIRRLWVIEDASELLEVPWTEQVGNVDHGFVCEKGECLGLDLEHRPTAHIDRAHEIRSKLPIRMTELT
eukprot:m.259716 g.259716  ORF g.259716 m.259716 type:complete len:140 (+) comp26643_c0_seq5:4692-5111(+)